MRVRVEEREGQTVRDGKGHGNGRPKPRLRIGTKSSFDTQNIAKQYKLYNYGLRDQILA